MDKKYYARWSNDECVDDFSKKMKDKFFNSEIYFLKQICSEIKDIIDQQILLRLVRS